MTMECKHKFIHLRTYGKEISWHNWKKIDVFFCEKCLKYEEREAIDQKGGQY